MKAQRYLLSDASKHTHHAYGFKVFLGMFERVLGSMQNSVRLNRELYSS